jgi:hypothetical protein
MKTLIAASLVISSLCIVGCKKEDKQVPRASQDNVATAPVDYLSRATKAEQSMEKNIDVTSLNNAIQLFNVQEGRFPTDLNELVTKKYLGKIPTPPFGSKLQYDAKTGKVSVVKG